MLLVYMQISKGIVYEKNIYFGFVGNQFFERLRQSSKTGAL